MCKSRRSHGNLYSLLFQSKPQGGEGFSPSFNIDIYIDPVQKAPKSKIEKHSLRGKNNTKLVIWAQLTNLAARTRVLLPNPFSPVASWNCGPFPASVFHTTWLLARAWASTSPVLVRLQFPLSSWPEFLFLLTRPMAWQPLLLSLDWVQLSPKLSSH